MEFCAIYDDVSGFRDFFKLPSLLKRSRQVVYDLFIQRDESVFTYEPALE